MNLKSRVKVLGIFSFCAILSCRGGDEENPADVLARVAGEMAAGNDLREVRFDDLNGDGQREVILVYGPRELLNFDVYYCTEGGDWKITPLVNDKQNPREFVSTRLDSIGDEDGDGRMEIQVSSRLYDGNTMVKEIHWGAVGYEVVSQRTVIARSAQAQPARPAATAAPQPKAAGGGTTQPALTAAAASAGDKKPETVAQPKPEPIPPITPSWGTYMVRKGDTVYGLANDLGASPEELEQFNNNQLASRGLRIGQLIRVPVPRARNGKVTVRIDKEDYVVRSGDTLIGIAQQQGVSVRAIQSWNQYLPADSTVKAGRKIKIHKAVIDIKN